MKRKGKLLNAESPSEELIEQIANAIRNGDGVNPATTPADPAILASQEFASMSPTARQEYSNRQLIETLNNQIEQLGTQLTESNHELADARNELLDLGTLRHSHRSARWIGAVTAIAMAIGGGSVSYTHLTLPTKA